MSRDEWLARVLALREKRKLLGERIYSIANSVETVLDEIDSGKTTASDGLTDVRRYAVQIKAWLDEVQ
jgi:hypothetical protein